MGQEGNEIIRTPGLSESSARFLTTSLFALVIAFPEPLKQYKSHPTAWDLHKYWIPWKESLALHEAKDYQLENFTHLRLMRGNSDICNIIINDEVG